MTITNWGSHYRFSATRIHRPATLDELQSLIERGRPISAIGSRHSFTGLADGSGDLVHLDRLVTPVSIDRERGAVDVSSAMQVGEMARQIAEQGWGLENLPGLPDMTIAGACATATHGSGDSFGPLSSLVLSVTLVAHDGEIVTIARGDRRFPAAVVSLGALGIVHSLRLALVGDYRVRQTVERVEPISEVVARLDGLLSSATRVSVFIDPAAWRGAVPVTVVRKQSVNLDESSIDDDDFPAAAPGSAAMTFDREREGSWARLLPHFVYPSLPDAASEIQSEYFVARAHGADALEAVRAAALRWDDHLVTAEIRTVAADEQWLSPLSRGDSLALHFTWRGHPAPVAALARQLEEVLEPFDPLPHWGKVFDRPPSEVGASYPDRDRARAVADELDPRRLFRTPFVKEVLGG